jgi:maltooligosyltrehalose trehalohydrolase
MNITVWAPSAKSVELVTPERQIPLHPQPVGHLEADRDAGVLGYAEVPGCAGGLGYWQTQVDAPVLARGYRYSIDGGEPIPDPRSMWQPDGVHGASHFVDTARLHATEPHAVQPDVTQPHAMQRPHTRHPHAEELQSGHDSGIRDHAARFVAKPLRDAVIYELHIGTFTPEGTYAAAQTKLPHLAKLGVTHVELMPLATFPGRRGWGYDGVDLYAPFPVYGTPPQLAAFVRACHARGIAVLLDVVYNHLGPDGNYLAQYGPYFTDRYKTNWGAAVNYDGPHSDPVRRFVIDNALMWLRDYGFDGLRLDAVHAIFSFDAVHVLEELAIAVRELGAKLGRSFVLIAESDLNDPRLVRPASQGGYGLDAHWADDFHHAVHRFFTGETDGYYADFHGLEDVATALREGYVYQGQYSPYRGRRYGRPPKGVGADQIVVCAQNHDQIGNRARGERLSMMLGVPQLKAIAALTVLSPFVPLLFQGEEWGAQTPFLYFTDHENAELGRLVAEGRSKEFSSFRWQGTVPNPQELETFARSKLNWSELSESPHAEIYQWYRQLIRLRHDRRGRTKAAVTVDAKAGSLKFIHGDVLCVFNFSALPQRVRMPRGEWDLVLRSDTQEATPADEVPGQATLIYRRRR